MKTLSSIIIPTLILLATIISCGEMKTKQAEKEPKENSIKETISETLPSADYSSLLINYECVMDVTEVANALKIPDSDVSIPKPHRPGQCNFSIKGFGQNGLGDDSTVIWYLEELGKAQVNKEIKSYLDDQANNEEALGMGIDLSETGDSYIVKRPMNGQVVIMNANYAHWLVLSYSPKHLYKSRTQEQHDALGEKMIVLANYLLKKHKK